MLKVELKYIVSTNEAVGLVASSIPRRNLQPLSIKHSPKMSAYYCGLVERPWGMLAPHLSTLQTNYRVLEHLGGGPSVGLLLLIFCLWLGFGRSGDATTDASQPVSQVGMISLLLYGSDISLLSLSLYMSLKKLHIAYFLGSELIEGFQHWDR